MFPSHRRATSTELPMAMRFRHLEKTSKEAVGVYRSLTNFLNVLILLSLLCFVGGKILFTYYFSLSLFKKINIFLILGLKFTDVVCSARGTLRQGRWWSSTQATSSVLFSQTRKRSTMTARLVNNNQWTDHVEYRGKYSNAKYTAMHLIPFNN